MRSATSGRKRSEPSGSLNTQWMIMSTPASSELTVPWAERQWVAVSLPNLRASSVMAVSSSTSNAGRSLWDVAVLPPVAVIFR